LKPWIILASSLMILLLYLALIPRYGALGAAYATLGGLMIHCAITYRVSQRVFRVHYEFGRMAGMLLTAMLVTAVAHFTRPDLIGLVHKALIWLAWPVILWIVGLVTTDEKQFLLSSVLRGREWLRARRLRTEEA
jgi:peptidoglycan biosynthesis protein MviN/MurJ (putative lipid II flippase)